MKRGESLACVLPREHIKKLRRTENIKIQKGRFNMKIREVLNRTGRMLECKGMVEETVKSRNETRNYGDDIATEEVSAYIKEINSTENVVKEKTLKVIPDDVKIGWIGQLDGQIRCEILHEDPQKVTLPTWEEDDLCVPDAYCSVYYYHVLAMSELLTGSQSDYKRMCDVRDEALNMYAKSVIRARA